MKFLQWLKTVSYTHLDVYKRQALTRAFPDRAEGLFERSEVESTKRYAHLKRLQDLYAPEA